ncbi:IPExxxVDY family protein [Aquimarina spongiae]|uniref:IPExxxVDY family protein n=1 Tax=Aquimarina spongiae TaxID=570521 RepID=A0A1M6FHJ1_9FLAO|nr:IPExxxVDY family protein [Aquimarina spongiae]SHI97145.1 hypothetical protein SAMN04488508_104289 [Aquimarina spongiae]
MAVQRLVLDAITDDEYELIAIHCSLASYRLAFLLNKHLGLQLFRKEEDVNFEYDNLVASFPIYQYEDHFKYNTYHLFANQFRTNIVSQNPANTGLFETAEETYVTKYLIPELKNVDYFLKIETEATTFLSKPMLSDMLGISQIVTAYPVEHKELKSKNNLIFE